MSPFASVPCSPYLACGQNSPPWMQDPLEVVVQLGVGGLAARDAAAADDDAAARRSRRNLARRLAAFAAFRTAACRATAAELLRAAATLLACAARAAALLTDDASGDVAKVLGVDEGGAATAADVVSVGPEVVLLAAGPLCGAELVAAPTVPSAIISARIAVGISTSLRRHHGPSRSGTGPPLNALGGTLEAATSGAVCSVQPLPSQ